MLFNRPRAVALMQQHSLDVIVATSAVNVRYFSDYFCWTDSSFKEFMLGSGSSNYSMPIYSVFLKESGQTILIISPSTATDAPRNKNVQIYTYGKPSIDLSGYDPEKVPEQRELFDTLRDSSASSSATDVLINYLVSEKLDAARIGLEMEGLNPLFRDRILDRLPRAETLDCSELLRVLRMVKSDDEITRLKRAFRVAEGAAMESLSQARAGISMQELINTYKVLIAQGGMDFGHFAYGLQGTGIATQKDYILRRGDFLFVDFGCLNRGYYSDAGLTLAVGDPGSAPQKVYSAFVQCQERAAQLMKPGVKSSAVAEAMHAVLMEKGITGCLPHGHGLGLEIREYPLVYRDNGRRITDGCIDISSDIVLEKDMVPVLEVSLFQFGLGSVHLEKSFRVTGNSCEHLIDQQREKMLILG